MNDQYLLDVAAYFVSKGFVVDGNPYYFRVETGWGGYCETCSYEMVVGVLGMERDGVEEVIEMSDFEMGEFMRFIYQKHGVTQ